MCFFVMAYVARLKGNGCGNSKPGLATRDRRVCKTKRQARTEQRAHLPFFVEAGAGEDWEWLLPWGLGKRAVHLLEGALPAPGRLLER